MACGIPGVKTITLFVAISPINKGKNLRIKRRRV